MGKSDEIEKLEVILLKARRRMSDEPNEDEEDVSPEEAGMREFDPDAEEGDDADKWLEENDKEKDGDNEEPTEPDESYDEYAPGEDEESHQQDPKLDEESTTPEAAAATTESGAAEEVPQEQTQKEVGRFPQPTREEIAEMRQYTRPWEQNAREKTALEANPSKNPELYHRGQLLEASKAGHKNYEEAHAAMQASPKYQGANPIVQEQMDSDFESNFH